jgi:hypothetical protein
MKADTSLRDDWPRQHKILCDALMNFDNALQMPYRRYSQKTGVLRDLTQSRQVLLIILQTLYGVFLANANINKSHY